MRTKKIISPYLILLLLSILVSLIGVALSTSIVVNSVSNRLGLQNVYRDGWTEPLAHIDLSKLPPGIEKVHLVFDSFRPKSTRAAQLLVRLCNEKVAELQVTPQLSDFWVNVPASCQQGLLEFEVKNPFISVDKRKLGVRLVEADFRYHIVNAIKFDRRVIISCLVLFIIIYLLYRLKLPDLLAACIGLALLILTTYCLTYISWDNDLQLLCLGLCIIFVLTGTLVKEQAINKYQAGVGFRQNNYFVLIIISLITVIGAVLRFYAIDFGFPDRYHPDEPRKAQIALKMVQTGDLDPNYFLHPSLLLYLTALLTKISYTLGIATQLDSVLSNLCGRMVSAIAGSLSIPLLFLMARELFSNRVALAASAFFAVSPLAITCSRYLKEDSLLLFFVLLTAYLAFYACKRNSFKLLLLAGLTAGFASGSKYSGMLAFTAIALTPWLKSQSIVPDFRQLLWVAAAGCLVPVGFLITTPYALLNSSKFISNFIAEKGHMISGHHKVVISSWSQYWMYHMSRSLPPAMSWPVIFAAITAIGIFIRNFRINGLIIVAMFLAFYLPAESVNAKPEPQPERYIFPCLPFMALLAAYTCEVLHKNSKAFGSALLTVLIVFPLYRTVGLASEIKPDSRVLMADWVKNNIPAGSTFLIDAQPYSAFLPADRYISVPMWTIDQRRSMTVENLKNWSVSEKNPENQQIIRKVQIDYLLLTSPSYKRYFLTRSADQVIRERFADVFSNWKLIKEINTEFGYYGFHNPTLRLYKVEYKEQ